MQVGNYRYHWQRDRHPGKCAVSKMPGWNLGIGLVLAAFVVPLVAGTSACGDDDTGTEMDAATHQTDASAQGGDAGERNGDAGLQNGTITVDATFQAGTITTGYRATVAVYRYEDYGDYSARPTGMPMAALLGQEADDHIEGTIMDLGQTAPKIFDPGKYSVVIGVANATGMPSHLDGTPWIAKSVTIEQEGQLLSIGPDDPDWKSE